MRSLTAEAKVGILVLLAISGLLASMRGLRKELAAGGRVHYTELDSAAGLVAGGRVEIAGVPVGHIERILEKDGRALVELRVRREKKLPAGTTIRIDPDGMLGSRVLRIVPGPPESGRYLAEGDTIPATPATADLQDVLGQVSAIARDVQAITGSLRNAVGTPEGEARLERMIEDLAVFSANLAQVSVQNREAIDQLVRNMLALSERLNGVVETTGEDLDETFAEVKKAAVKLDSSLASIDSVAGKIDRGEGTLGKLVNDDETVESLNQAVAGVNDVLERVNRIRVFVDYQGDFQVARADGREGAMKNTFLFRIQPHEDYGYLVGVSDDPLGLRTQKTTRTVADPDGAGPAPGVESLTETEKLSSTYLLTAQIFRRWGPVTGRIGLKEGTGGVGADLWLYRDRFKLSADVYQFTREREGRFGAERTELPRVRLQGRYNLNEHLFLVGGVDDVISNYDRRAVYVGAGFQFNDDDLKYLMGSIPGR